MVLSFSGFDVFFPDCPGNFDWEGLWLPGPKQATTELRRSGAALHGNGGSHRRWRYAAQPGRRRPRHRPADRSQLHGRLRLEPVACRERRADALCASPLFGTRVSATFRTRSVWRYLDGCRPPAPGFFRPPSALDTFRRTPKGCAVPGRHRYERPTRRQGYRGRNQARVFPDPLPHAILADADAPDLTFCQVALPAPSSPHSRTNVSGSTPKPSATRVM